MRKRLMAVGFLALTVFPVVIPGVGLFAQPTREERANNPNPPTQPPQQPPPTVNPTTNQSYFCVGGHIPGVC